jgi:acetolactate synthase-1/2/3 large subunit
VAKIALAGDARHVLEAIWESLRAAAAPENRRGDVRRQIRDDKAAYLREWYEHDSGDRVNPARFFTALRRQLSDDDYVVADDGHHTFLTVELMPIHASRHFISPTDFNCMGYCVPAAIATKMMHPDKQVVGIVGDGSFVMTCMELVTAVTHRAGVVLFVFHDGELTQISQAQEALYNRKTCTILGRLDVSGVARATGARFLSMANDTTIEDVIATALASARERVPVLVDVNIDSSKRTRFTEGLARTNAKRFPLSDEARILGRAVIRRITD